MHSTHRDQPVHSIVTGAKRRDATLSYSVTRNTRFPDGLSVLPGRFLGLLTLAT